MISLILLKAPFSPIGLIYLLCAHEAVVGPQSVTVFVCSVVPFVVKGHRAEPGQWSETKYQEM